MENVNELILGGKKNISLISTRTYQSSTYKYAITLMDRIKMLFSDSVDIEVIPATLKGKVAHATSVYFKYAVPLVDTTTDEHFSVANKLVKTEGVLRFVNYEELIDYYMSSQEESIRSCVAGYNVNPDLSIYLRYGHLDPVWYLINS